MSESARKRRTRQHVLAELGANYTERVVLECGFTTLRIEEAEGESLAMFTYTSDGELESGQVFLLPKGTEDVEPFLERGTIRWEVSRAEVEHWLAEPMPCMLVLYDAKTDTAYWSYLQAEFQNKVRSRMDDSEDTVTVRIEKRNMLSRDAVLQFVRYRDTILSKVDRMILHRA